MIVYLVYCGDAGRFDIFDSFEGAELAVEQYADEYSVVATEQLESELIAGVHPRDGLGILEYKSEDGFHARIQSRTVYEGFWV